jgi:uncharacterized protein (UPF0332 family)
LKTAELIARARRSATSAKLLFEAGDLNGACNRACYAMFDAARAALLASKEPLQSEVIKTHSDLIVAFSLHLIKSGRIPTLYGKSLRQVDQIRLIADYSDEEVDRETASSAIEQADRFVGAVKNYLSAYSTERGQ